MTLAHTTCIISRWTLFNLASLICLHKYSSSKILSSCLFNLRSWHKTRRQAALCWSFCPNEDMAFCFKHFVRISIILLLTSTLCKTTTQRWTSLFMENKKVATSHTTLQPISKIRCVERCNRERQNNRCTLAGYNKATNTCYLSVDDSQDVLDTTDNMSGVFFHQPDSTSI